MGGGGGGGGGGGHGPPGPPLRFRRLYNMSLRGYMGPGGETIVSPSIVPMNLRIMGAHTSSQSECIIPAGLACINFACLVHGN